jgi:putative ABC transport system permease protein
MLNDLRYAIRILIKSRGFTIASLTALMLGIGATTAMFSAVNSVLLRPLPFPDAERLFAVRETRAVAGFERTVVSEGEYLQWARNNPLFEHAAVVDMPGLSVRLGDAPERVPALRVPSDFFPLFGVMPAAGRTFGRDAEQPGRGDVILISYNVWQRRFDGAADAVGRSVSVEGRPATIIGILPKDFSFGGRIDAVVPMTLGADQAAEFSAHSLDMYARLAAGVTTQQAAANLTKMVLATQGTPPHATGVALVPLRDQVLGDSQASILMLFGAVGLVLLIACANIANLLLSRTAARQKELAVRAALGATRARVVRQLVTESLLLSGVGGVLGVVLASWLTALLARLATDSIPRAIEIDMDPRAVAFAVLLSYVSALLFGVAPAVQAARFDVGTALKQDGRGGSSRSRTRALAAFATAEIALALTLLIGAGLLLASFRNLRHVDAGFDPTNVVTAPAYLPEWKYKTEEACRVFVARAVADIASIPGVTGAAAVNVLPLSGNNSSGALTVEGFPPPPPNQRESANRRAITADYFATMRTPILAGRAFSDTDNEHTAGVVIVSRSLAERYWPAGNAIGKRLKLARYAAAAPWLTVVGVAANVRHDTLATMSRPVVYYPHAQRPDGTMDIVVRSNAATAAITNAVREALQRIDPDLPVDGIGPLSRVVQASLSNQQLELGLLGAFALLAVALAAAGVYGVMAYAVAQRMQEFSVRLALGATAQDIIRLVAGYGFRLTAVGVALGAVCAWAWSVVLSGVLYGVRATDPVVFGSAALLLAAIAMAACILPVRRVLRASPVAALRAQ